MTDTNKIPPQAVDLEEAVVAAILIEGTQALDQVTDLIFPECFYKEAHQVIYQAILDLSSHNKAIDLLTVTEQLKKTGKLNEVGGPLFLAQLISEIATALHITDHARILKQKFIQRQIIRYSQETLEAGYNDSVDPDDLLQETNSKMEKIMEFAYGKNSSLSFRDLLNESLKQYEEREKLSKDGKTYGIRTPLVDLNKLTGGWQNSDLIIIAGRPSMGKTAFGLTICKTAAREGKHICMFSLEMKGTRLADRMICGEAGINPERYRNGHLTTDEWEIIEKSLTNLLDLGIHIDDNSLISPEYVRARSRILKKKGQCDLIIIDYLQLINGRQKNRNREQEVSEISRKCKLLAMDLDVPVILLSQLNRSCEYRADKRPHLSDLRESGAIEQDSDFVGFLYRPEYYGFTMDDDSQNSLEGIGELIVAKQRNGRTGTIRFGYSADMTRIFDASRPGDLEPIMIKSNIADEDFKSRQYKDSPF